ncbi:MAG TPA: polysaccharide deacetylase family protein [Candidatus Dormibacteraeota bacterium]|jgi:peptidoglycan/xylan/chitin deacetylase (PgdA/CDA1 family)|nr:polysaccharide deacetylase family protein [Candidatus Dormibacteraeota bacterium]
MPPSRVWPRRSFPGRRLALSAIALACALVATVSGALVDAGRTLPETAVAAPAAGPLTSLATPAVSIEDTAGGAGIPLADLFLAGGEDRLLSAPRPSMVDIRHRSGPRLIVPILMYHYVRVNPVRQDRLGDSLSVTPRDFAAQMALLHHAGVTTVTLDDVVTALGGGRPLPPRAVVLTFDDGYRDFSTAAVPVLRAHGFRATVFVVSGFLGRPGYMTADDVVAAAGAGMTIGAHTVHHVQLTRIPVGLARVEIEVSRRQLEQLSGQPVNDFAYPYGDTSRTVQAMVASAGFHDAVTTVFGASEEPRQQLTLSRVRIEGGDSLATVAAKVLAPLGLHPGPGAATLPSATGLAERVLGAPY